MGVGKRNPCLWFAIAPLILLLLTLTGTPFAANPDQQAAGGVTIHFFWGEGCPHCAKATVFLDELKQRCPSLHIRSYEVYSHQENVDLLMKMAKERGTEVNGVPTIIIGDRVIAGFSDDTTVQIEAQVKALLAAHQPETAATPPAMPPKETDAVTIPLLGKLDPAATSLPVFTAVIAALDSFNPCAFFVLLFLLSLLVHAHSRIRMAIIGGTFVFFSGFVYFLFMAAWLNLFLLAGTLAAVTTAAGIIALGVALINIKDFFFFEKGVSLVIPEEKKPKLFERMRGLVRADSLPAMLTGTVVLATAANSYELLCTAGFPMVFTRVLTLNALPPSTYYLYLVFYNLVYVVPLALIVGIFTATLGSRKLSEWQGRVLKLLSGVMMLMLGLVILIKPALLNNAAASVVLLVLALLVTTGVAWLARRISPDIAKHHAGRE
ncbi:MAG: glutaredoxin [Desulfuromonadales bacterium]|nr:MAG: glutaredoxin [Desulfuromonadales bacterium]